MRTSKKLLALCLILAVCCCTVMPSFSWYDRSASKTAGKIAYSDEYESAGYVSGINIKTYKGKADGHNVTYDTKPAIFSDTDTVTLNAVTDNISYYKTVIENTGSTKAKFNLFLKSLYTYTNGVKDSALSNKLYVGTTNPIYNKQAYSPKYSETTAEYNKYRIYFSPGIAWQDSTEFYLCYFDAIEDRDYIKMTLAGDMESGDKIYFQPGSQWEADSARMAAYFFKGTSYKWMSMSDSDGDGIYECDKPSGYTEVIFCRMKGSNTTNNWDNCYNQTNDLTLIDDNCFKITEPYVDHDNNGGTSSQGRGKWFNFNTNVYYADIPEDSHGFYVTHSDDPDADGATRTPSIFFSDSKNDNIKKGYVVRLTGSEVDSTYHNMAYTILSSEEHGIAVSSYFDRIYGDVNASGVSVKLTEGTHYTGATVSYSASGSSVAVNSNGVVTLKETSSPTITTTLTSPFGDKLALTTDVRIVDPRLQVPVVENISIDAGETMEICWFVKNDSDHGLTYSIGGVLGSL